MRSFVSELRAIYHDMLASFGCLLWVWRDLYDHGAKRTLKILWLFYLLFALGGLAMPYLLGMAVEAVAQRELQIAIAVSVAFGLSKFVGWGSNAAMQICREWIWNRGNYGIARNFLKHILEQTLSFHLQYSEDFNHSVLYRAWSKAENLATECLRHMGASGVMVLITWLLLPLTSWLVFGVATVLLVVNILASLLINHSVMEAMKPIDQQFKRADRRIVQTMEQIERVITSGKSTEEVENCLHEQNKALMPDWQVWLKTLIRMCSRDLLGDIVVVGVMFYTTLQVLSGNMHVSQMIPAVVWIASFNDQLWSVGDGFRMMTKDLERLLTTRALFSIPPAFENNSGILLDTRNGFALECNHLSADYRTSRGGEQAVLRDVSFSVGPGERLAIIGSSGAGKSTILRLLLRYMDPDCGEITINEVSLKDYHLNHLRHQIAYVQQRPQIPDGTLREILLYPLFPDDREKLSDADLLRILERARLTEIMDERGLETRVGKDGVELSGGQQQRLVFATIFAKEVVGSLCLIIIDEGTSNLDAITEREIQAELNNLLLELSVPAIIITHHLATVRHVCTKFIVVRKVASLINGEPQVEAEARSFEELYLKSETFRLLSRAQGIVLTP